jgi:hypothetical protein
VAYSVQIRELVSINGFDSVGIDVTSFVAHQDRMGKDSQAQHMGCVYEYEASLPALFVRYVHAVPMSVDSPYLAVVLS